VLYLLVREGIRRSLKVVGLISDSSNMLPSGPLSRPLRISIVSCCYSLLTVRIGGSRRHTPIWSRKKQ